MSSGSVILEGPPKGRSLPDWTGYLKDLIKMSASMPNNEDLMAAIDDANSEIEFLKSIEPITIPA